MKGPLEGRKVLVTRPERQAQEFAEKLGRLGATPMLLPAIKVAPIENTTELDFALQHLEDCDWVVLTSVNGVEAVESRMAGLGIPTEQLSKKRLAVIGPATAAALERFCRKPDLMPAEYVAEAIARSLGNVEGQRFLLARADLARPDLALALGAAGATVNEVVAYRIVAADETRVEVDFKPDFITLTSSSAAKATFEKLIQSGLEDWLRTIPIVCIGPITAATVEEQGYRVAATANDYTTDGLIEALIDLSKKELANARHS